MKLGAENRTKTILALVLFAAAIFMLFRGFYNGGQPASAAPANANIAAQTVGTPAPRARRASRRPQPPAQNPNTPLVSLDPRLRLDLLKVSEDTEYKGAGRNIFRAEAEPVIPPPVQSPIIKKEDVEAKKTPEPPPGPPPPPPINLKFFGFVNGAGEPKKVFLAQGDDVFIAREGEIVGRRYKIVHITNNSVDIEDVLNNNRQTIPLTQG